MYLNVGRFSFDISLSRYMPDLPRHILSTPTITQTNLLVPSPCRSIATAQSGCSRTDCPPLCTSSSTLMTTTSACWLGRCARPSRARSARRTWPVGVWRRAHLPRSGCAPSTAAPTTTASTGCPHAATPPPPSAAPVTHRRWRFFSASRWPCRSSRCERRLREWSPYLPYVAGLIPVLSFVARYVERLFRWYISLGVKASLSRPRVVIAGFLFLEWKCASRFVRIDLEFGVPATFCYRPSVMIEWTFGLVIYT